MTEILLLINLLLTLAADPAADAGAACVVPVYAL